MENLDNSLNELFQKPKNIEQKKEVAKHIVEKLKESKGLLGKLKINIFDSWMEDFLVNE
ncbi:MAG: hypothetical protein GXP45_05595 [bacterium]|nr:hypothetical protein [bacterium]